MESFDDKLKRMEDEFNSSSHGSSSGGSGFGVCNEDGAPAEPLALLCEHSGCRKKATVDCSRKFILSDPWNSEPEALCEEHSQGRKVLRRLMAGQNPGGTL